MALDNPADQAALQTAHEALERSNYLIELANLAGKPIEFVLEKLPQRMTDAVAGATTHALRGALKIALSSIDPAHRTAARPWWHRGAVAFTGAAGGLFGWAGLSVELPLSTTIMLRSIADVARSEGEDLRDPAAALACIEVFGIGGRSASDDQADSGYFAIRAALTRSVSEAAAYIAERSAIEEGAPVLIRLVQKIAERFAPAVADKLAAQAIPAFGAIGGASINLLFINHFQSVAQGHFTVRRLERKYGPPRVQREYEACKKS